MIRASAFVGLMLLAGPALADELTVSGRPTVGQAYRYLIERSQEEHDGAKVTARTAKGSARIEVVGENEDGLVLSWTQEGLELGGEAGLDRAHLAEQLQLELIGYPIVYSVNGRGSPVMVTNIKGLRQRLDEGRAAVMKALGEGMGVAGATEDQAHDIEALTGEMLDAMLELEPADLAKELVPELALATYAFGMRLETEAPRAYETREASPFGGPSLTLAGTVETRSLDRQVGRLSIGWGERLEPAGVDGFIGEVRDTLEASLPPERSKPMIDKLEELARKTTVDRKGEVVLDLGDGMTIEASLRKELRVGELARIESMSMRRHP